MINNLMCSGEMPRYIFYASDIPQYIYYIFLPSIIVTVLLGFFIFFKDRKNISSQIFFVLTIVMASWMISMLGNWAQNDPRLSILFDAFNVLVSIIPVVFIFFILNTFYQSKSLTFLNKLVIVAPIIPIIILLPSKFNVESIELSWCETTSGKLYWYMAFILIIYALLAIFLLLKKIKEFQEIERKKQVIFVLCGFLIWTIISVIMGVLTPLLGFPTSTLWAPISCTLFAAFITWSIVRYRFLDIKLMAVQALVVAIIIIVGSQFFFIQNNTNRILTGITLILASAGGWILVKSVKLEVERKEELQLMTTKLAMANDQLRKLDNAKSEFISIASHQLRTPLTAIKGFISLLLEGAYGKVDAMQRDILNKVYSSNERLITLVEDMLNLSRIEAGRMEYTLEKVRVENVIQEVYDTFVIRAREKNVSLDIIFPDYEPPEVTTDKNKIREVISNLVDNAVKYTVQGGVAIKFTKEESGYLRVAISDSGVGIPDSEMPFLFSKFSRGRDITRLNTGGTGLGLHVGKLIIEALKGKIWAESGGEGKGATFFIELPLEAPTGVG